MPNLPVPKIPSPGDLIKKITGKSKSGDQKQPAGKDKKEPPLTPEEKHRKQVEDQMRKVETYYEKMIYRETHKEDIIRKWALIVIGIGLGIMAIIGLVILVRYIPIVREWFKEPPPPPVVDAPPSDFAVLVENTTLLPNTASENTYDALVRIKVNNDQWGVSKFDYQTRLKGENKETVGEYSGFDFILPGETKYLAMFGIKTERTATSAETTISNLEAKKLSRERDFNIQSQNITFSKPDNNSQVKGLIINDGIFDLKTVKILVLVFDKNGQPIAVNQTIENTFCQDDRREFALSWPYQIASGQTVTVEKYVDAFSASTIIDCTPEESLPEF